MSSTITLLTVLIVSCTIPGHSAFHVALPAAAVLTTKPWHNSPVVRRSNNSNIKMTHLAAARYGPTDNDDLAEQRLRQQEEKEDAATKKALEELVSQLMQAKEEHIPSLLGNHVELIVNLRGYQLEELLEEAYQSGGAEWQQRVGEAVEVLVGFAESFVLELKGLDDVNKKLLGKIIRTISERKTEDELDELLEQEKEHFTPGFLRHLEGECERIANAPSTTAESMKLMQVLRTIQVRVVEELGKDMGEGALVLGQLLGYDNPQERLAVLQAGLQMRGEAFARELLALTEEALENFARVNADPELIDRVRGVNVGVQDFLKIAPK